MDLLGCGIDAWTLCPNQKADGSPCLGYEGGETGECAACMEVRFYYHNFDYLNILNGLYTKV